MNKVYADLERSAKRDLERVIEPLAGYICAAHRPKAVLAAALAVLVREVEQTRRAARRHLATSFSESQWS